MKRGLFWFGLLVSLIFLFFALRGLHFERIIEVVKLARLTWLWAVIPVYFLSLWFRSLRWHYLLLPIKNIRTKELYGIMAIGYMGNNIFPARAGEVLRSIVLKHKQNVPIAATLASIIIERILDGVVMLGFIFFNLGELNKLTDSSGFVGSIRSLALWGSILFISILIAFLISAKYPQKANGIGDQIFKHILPKHWQDKVMNTTKKFFTGIEALNSTKIFFYVIMISILIWLLETSVYWIVMQAFPFKASFFALMLMNGILNLSTTLPSAPGYIGTFDAPGIALLGAIGVEKNLAAGFTLILHAALWLPITLLGAYFFAREGLDWNDELKKVRTEKEEI